MDLSTAITLLGLVLDLAGAIIIGIPDIPQFREYHRPGRMREALRELEATSLTPESTGYEDLKKKLEERTGQSITEDAEELFVTVSSMTIAKGSDSGIRRRLAIQQEDGEEKESKLFQETDFVLLRHSLERTIREGEAYMRAKGFMLLASGFLFQIFGITG